MAESERDAIARDRVWQSGYSAGRAAAMRALAPSEALQEIYNGARRVDGVCRWCGAPPPDEERDHDVACPAAKAGYALGLPGYRDWVSAAAALRPARLPRVDQAEATFREAVIGVQDGDPDIVGGPDRAIPLDVWQDAAGIRDVTLQATDKSGDAMG